MGYNNSMRLFFKDNIQLKIEADPYTFVKCNTVKYLIVMQNLSQKTICKLLQKGDIYERKKVAHCKMNLQ